MRLDLNLDLEVRLRAHVHGDLTLALLYFPLKEFLSLADERFLGGEDSKQVARYELVPVVY